jgi:hypothetical protein
VKIPRAGSAFGEPHKAVAQGARGAFSAAYPGTTSCKAWFSIACQLRFQIRCYLPFLMKKLDSWRIYHLTGCKF